MSSPKPVTNKENSLPPGQKLTNNLPILHCGLIPDFNPSSWDLRIWGAVENAIEWTWDEVLALPRTQVRLDLHCVTTWSLLNTQWEGISLQTLINEGLIKPKPEAKYLMQHADFGYTTNLPLETALQDNFILATHYEGKPLSPEHGYPLRGVIGAIPNRKDLKACYLWKGAKWLRGLEFLEQDQLGFWEANGYHNEADVWLEQRKSS